MDQTERDRLENSAAGQAGNNVGMVAGILLPGPGGKGKLLITISKHLPKQAIGRGFTSPRILDILRKGTPVPGKGRYGPQTRYTLNGNTVVVNDKGKIITVFSNAPGTRNGLGKGNFIP